MAWCVKSCQASGKISKAFAADLPHLCFNLGKALEATDGQVKAAQTTTGTHELDQLATVTFCGANVQNWKDVRMQLCIHIAI